MRDSYTVTDAPNPHIQRARDIQRAHPEVTVAAIGDGLRFMYPSLLARYLQGLRLAGLQ